MHAVESHKQIRPSEEGWLLRATAWTAIPAAAALIAGTWLGWQAAGSQSDRLELARISEITAQGRLASESLSGAIESLRSRAIAFQQLRAAGVIQAEPSSPILHWAELEIQGSSVHSVKQHLAGGAGTIDWRGVNGVSGESIEESYLAALSAGLSLRELRENGVAMVRVKLDPARTTEWLALAFASRESKGSVVAVLVDPAEAFAFFRRIPTKAEAGSLRAYLVGADGRVFAHSQSEYVNADFSRASVFTEAVRPMMQGTRMSGTGAFRGIDQLAVLASFSRQGNLPLGVVVERASGDLVSAEAFSSIWQRLAGQLMAIAGGLVLLVMGCAWKSRRRRVVAGVELDGDRFLAELTMPAEGIAAAPEMAGAGAVAIAVERAGNAASAATAEAKISNAAKAAIVEAMGATVALSASKIATGDANSGTAAANVANAVKSAANAANAANAAKAAANSANAVKSAANAANVAKAASNASGATNAAKTASNASSATNAAKAAASASSATSAAKSAPNASTAANATKSPSNAAGMAKSALSALIDARLGNKAATADAKAIATAKPSAAESKPAAAPIVKPASKKRMDDFSDLANQILDEWSQGPEIGTGAELAGTPILAPAAIAKPAASSREQDIALSASREALRLSKEESAVIDQFEREASRLRDPRLVAQSLAGTASRLCYSPTLFFAFHERVRAGILSADGGFNKGEAPVGMSFPIDDALVAQIVQAERKGETASLSDYAPLQKVLNSRLGVAHFEAWAVTGYGHLGRQGGRPRVLGILVILQSGYESATRHDSLSRMMRATGLIYENALLSQ